MQQIVAEYSSPSLMKITEPKKLFANKEKLSWVQIVDTIRKECCISRLDAIIVCRQMVESSPPLLTPQEGSLILTYFLKQEESEFFAYQRKLQDAFFDEGSAKSILTAEAKSLEKQEFVTTVADEEFRGRHPRSRNVKNESRNNKPIKQKKSEHE